MLNQKLSWCWLVVCAFLTGGMFRPAEVRAGTVLVTNTNDTGQGSLREAIHQANQNSGTIIRFRIPANAAGYFVIQPRRIFPSITASGTVIDGTSQTAFTGNTNPKGPEVMLNGSLTHDSGSGLRLNAANCIIRGLVINAFKYDGITIDGPAALNNRVQGCFIGIDHTGTRVVPNGTYGVSVFGAAKNNTIGGYTASERNVISGNTWAGVLLNGRGTSGNAVAGNIIGLDASGTRPLPNTGGVAIFGAPQGNIIGGLRAGARNVISGNRLNGVHILSEGSNGNVVQGNYIGTTATGRMGAGNREAGVKISGGVQNNLIGGNVIAARNVISGNVGDGVSIFDEQTDNNIVQGNFIGTDLTGTVPLSNHRGVSIFYSAANNLIGGPSPATRNVISGNRSHGISIDSSATANSVQFNFIGTDVSGMRPMGNREHGVIINDAIANTIGGSSRGNRIAFNGGDGVLVSTLHGRSASNAIRGNSCFRNGGLGINLKPYDEAARVVTSNDDMDDDAGPNNLQNFPVLTSAILSANGVMTITGKLNSKPSPFYGSYTLDFYRNSSAEASGHGEGETYIGSKNVSADSTGNVNFVFAFNFSGNMSGPFYTVTATQHLNGDTSEFSNAVRAVTSHSISGTVLTFGDGGQSQILANVAITLQDSAGRTTTVRTNSNGQYVFSNQVAGIYTLKPQLSGYVFSPAIRTVTIRTTSLAGINFTASRSD